MMDIKQLGPGLIVAAAFFFAAGCSMFESEQYQQARSELESAATAAAEKDWELALQHADRSIDLYPQAAAYLCRATARMNRPVALDDVPARHRETVLVLLRIDDSIADVKSGLKLEPSNQDLIALDNQFASRKRLAEIQQTLQAPSLSDTFDKAQAFEFCVLGPPGASSSFEDLNKRLRSMLDEIDESPRGFPRPPPAVAELLGLDIKP